MSIKHHQLTESHVELESNSRKRDVFGCHVNLFVSTFGDRAKNGRKTGVGWAIGSNNLTSWSQLTPSLCWVGAVFVLQTALATRNGQSRLQKRPAQQNRASRMAFEDIAPCRPPSSQPVQSSVARDRSPLLRRTARPTRSAQLRTWWAYMLAS